ncbi:winged helix-turn-helix domain-containing protein [Curtobacterium sp. ODYSSEY 48 V2]|uniref:HTH domain-containing protein n=1 Tax=Curtobacterium sp. ODYSSEY 48 V2 TaxID=2939561 RepID=UPI00203D9447|nr:HTH domain-containing protein [Curtobacterium sp. ODYSSEY 48 V2]MCM3504886.1 winged helix-turn-helix domain-containing protein [Curtobacterium sp. ODYSSEY 48 V2]
MTLHEAMIEVLRDAGAPMTSREIADVLNARQLYRRRDGRPLAAGQVSARARNYDRLFIRTTSQIHLR